MDCGQILYTRFQREKLRLFLRIGKRGMADLSDGKYRIIKKIYETIEDEIHTHYLAVEFEIR